MREEGGGEAEGEEGVNGVLHWVLWVSIVCIVYYTSCFQMMVAT